MWTLALYGMSFRQLGETCQRADSDYLTADGGIDAIVAHENWQIASNQVRWARFPSTPRPPRVLWTRN